MKKQNDSTMRTDCSKTAKASDKYLGLHWAIFAVLLLVSGSLLAESEPLTDAKLNGSFPPGKVSRASETLMIDQEHPTGHRVVIMRTIRPKGTRTPIHQHPSSGTTCVLSGEMTLYLEGASPKKAVAGSCYAMPSDKKMAGVNSGTEDAEMLDIFFTPSGGALWTVMEPMHHSLQDQFSSSFQ